MMTILKPPGLVAVAARLVYYYHYYHDHHHYYYYYYMFVCQSDILFCINNCYTMI